MVFDGEELLPFAVKAIRPAVNHISVTYQTTSYFGNPARSDLLHTLKQCDVDELIHYEPDLTLHPKENELKLRNIGLEASKRAGCTHHISSDVDEFYIASQLETAKYLITDHDCSIVINEMYYKDPTFKIVPCQNLMATSIHPVSNYYEMSNFPYPIEQTRRHHTFNKCKVFTKEELIIHHMSYVRRDISRKLNNSQTGPSYNLNRFLEKFDKYQVGQLMHIAPDFLNRRTILVEDQFNIKGAEWAHHL